MITLVNDRVGYIPDDENWERMNAAFVRGCAENAMITNLVEMLKGSTKQNRILRSRQPLEAPGCAIRPRQQRPPLESRTPDI
jgi:hypothetical protein